MKEGKLNWYDLKQIIDENRSINREDVRIKSGVGEDCSVINFGEYECVVSTDPITGAGKNIGKLAVNINCNDIASCGVEPLGILITILAPEGTNLSEIKSLMNEIDKETKNLNVEILGGHTEITNSVNKLIVSCTVLGRALSDEAIASSGAVVGDDIIVTKDLCLEGTSIIANDYYDKISDILSIEELNEAKSYIKNISVLPEGKIAGEFGVNAMHDITEGGVLGALWEVAAASNVGFKVYNEKMPLTDITKKICNHMRIDPLRLISSGSMLISCKDGQGLVDKLHQNKIKASIIGNITKEKGLLVIDGKEIEIEPPKRDELFSNVYLNSGG